MEGDPGPLKAEEAGDHGVLQQVPVLLGSSHVPGQDTVYGIQCTVFTVYSIQSTAVFKVMKVMQCSVFRVQFESGS